MKQQTLSVNDKTSDNKDLEFNTIVKEWNQISGIKKFNKSKRNKDFNKTKKNILKIKKNISYKNILESIEIFKGLSGNSKLFNLDRKFLTLKNFLYIDYNEFDEINHNNRFDYLRLTSESFCMDCLSSEILKYNIKSNIKSKQPSVNKSKFSPPTNKFIDYSNDYLRLSPNSVGDKYWKTQRACELLSQVYLEYLEKHDNFSFNNLEENYINNLLSLSKNFLKFIEYNDDKIFIIKSNKKPYYFLSERIFKLFPVLRKFLEEVYPKGNFVLAWIKSSFFRKQLKQYLEENGFYNKKIEDSRFSRKDYRDIAKKANRLYFGNIINTPEFKDFLQEKDKVVEENSEQTDEFDFSGFSREEIKNILAEKLYDDLYNTNKAEEIYLNSKKMKSIKKSKTNLKERERCIIRFNWKKIIEGGIDTRVFPPCHIVWNSKEI